MGESGKGRANTTWVEVVRNEVSTWRSGDYGFVQVEWQNIILVGASGMGKEKELMFLVSTFSPQIKILQLSNNSNTSTSFNVVQSHHPTLHEDLVVIVML